MNKILRKAGRRLFPSLAAERAIHYERAVRARLGVPEVARQASARLGHEVIGGPFASMRLVSGFEEDTASPVLKLIGSYEPMLAAAIEAAIASEPTVVANVGCADGYYAVGLARRLPEATVHAYDLAVSARKATTRLAEINGVSERVRVRGRCRSFPKGIELLVCDIEGDEIGLVRGHELRAATIIVETHDQLVPGACDRLRGRFASTHEIDLLRFQEANATDLVDWMTPEQRSVALDDLRESEQQRWLIMWPRSVFAGGPGAQ